MDDGLFPPPGVHRGHSESEDDRAVEFRIGMILAAVQSGTSESRHARIPAFGSGPVRVRPSLRQRARAGPAADGECRPHQRAAYWHAGNFVGGPELFGQGTHVWSGVAASNSVVLHLTGKALRGLITRIPALSFGLIEGLTFKGKCYSALAQMLGTRSVTERLAHLLLHLCDAYGVEEAGSVVIGTALTHADLAHMVGATRQWVTISLKRLAAQGVLQAEKSKIVVHQIDTLQAMRGGG
ncbi:MAG: hypothetical protein B7Z30_01245 [Rhizobiales bacterium 12-68-15]|nr:MAG: hypothetical protein B7Z30_01245 [Rhizobiales bacterium 12-68-15]